MKSPRLWVGLLLISAAIAAVYHPALSFPFVWTDHAEIEEKVLVPLNASEVWNALTLPKGRAKVPLREAFQAAARSSGYAYFRPMQDLTYGLDQLTGVGSAQSFHLTNLLLHAAFCLMSLLFVRALFAERFPSLAEAIALWQALAPVHVEPVVWVSARVDLLWGLGMMTGLWLLARPALESPRAWLRPLGLLALTLFVAESKETGLVCVPIFLVFLSLTPGESKPADRTRRVLGLALAIGLGAALYLLHRFLVVCDLQPGALFQKPGPGLWTLLHLFGLNLLQSVVPTGLTVADAVEIATGPDWLAVLGPLVWLVWLGLGLRHRARSFVPLFCAIGWICSIAPVSQLIPLLQPRGERYLYVPSFFAELAIGYAFALLLQRVSAPALKKALCLAVLASLGALAPLSIQRAMTWADERVLFQNAVREVPQCAECWNNLAYAEAVRGNYPAAASACLRSLAVDRTRIRCARDGLSVRLILINALLEMGKGAPALPWIADLIAHGGPSPASLELLARALLYERKTLAALLVMQEIERRTPSALGPSLTSLARRQISQGLTLWIEPTPWIFPLPDLHGLAKDF